MKVLIYESFKHFVPTGNGWAKGFEDLGHIVYKLPSDEYNITDLDEKIDLLILHDLTIKKSKDLLEYKKVYPKTKVAVLCSTFESYFDNIKDYVDLWFNLSIKNSYLQNFFSRYNMKFKSINLAANQDEFYSLDVQKIYDVSFIGQIGIQGHGYRSEDKYLFPVIDKYPSGFYGGFKYKQQIYPAINHSLLNEIYNKTKVNLNFHYSNQKVENKNDIYSRIELNGRTFEIALSGNFHISDHPLITEFFEDSIPYIKQDNWLDSIDYYLNNENERNRLANKARKIALENHKYSYRAIKILNELNIC